MNVIIAGVIMVAGIAAGIYFVAVQPKVGTPPEERIKFRRYAMQSAAASIAVGMILTSFALFGYPQYKVWQQSKEGEAALAKAEQDRQIAVQEALATQESAEKLAQAERTRADGTAAANETIGKSLTEYPKAATYLWLQALKETKNQVVYIPTESGMPITEAGKNKDGSTGDK